MFCIVDYGETKIKWKTTALTEFTQFNCGGIHKHVDGCIVGNFETKHKSPNDGQRTAFTIHVTLITISKRLSCRRGTARRAMSIWTSC